MLSRESAELALRLAEEVLDQEAAFDIAAGLVTFGVDSASWRDVGLRTARLLERGDDAALGVNLIASIPGAPVRSHLEDLARREGEAVGLEAAKVVRDGVTGDDPLAPHVAELLERVSDPTDVAAFRALACLDLDRLDVPRATFAAGRKAADPTVRFWAAVAAAKSGDTQAALDLLETLAEDPPPFFFGDPWSAYGEVAAAAPVPAALASALAERYTTDLDRDQSLVIGALTGRWDAEGRELAFPAANPPSAAPRAGLDELDLDVVSDLVLQGVLLAEPARVGPDKIAGLGPADAGRLLSRLAEQTMQATGHDRLELGNLTMRVTALISRADVSVSSLVDSFAEDPTSMFRIQLGAVLARGNHDELAAAVVDAARGASPATQAELAGLLRDTATCAATGATPLQGSGPGLAVPAPPAPPPLTPPPPVVAYSRPPLDPSSGPPPQAPRGASGGWLRRLSRLRPSRRGPRGQRPASTRHEDLPVEAHPLLDAPSAVVARVPFEVRIGLTEFARQTGTETAGAIPTRQLAAGGDRLLVAVELVVDPSSLTLAPSSSYPLTVTLEMTARTPFPSVTVTLEAQTSPELLAERTLRLLFRVDGRVVGLAKRRVVVVDTEDQLSAVPDAPPLSRQMLDLRPLLREKAPDLVVGVYRSDESADTFVWDVYPLASTHRLTDDDDRRTRIPTDARDHAGYIRRTVAAKGATPLGTYRALAGYGEVVARTMPKALRRLLVSLVAGQETAPSLLLLTEEALVPWELAVLQDPPLRSTAGGEALFLGAHVTISRWPCDQDGPPAGPSVQLSVDRRAVLTADYAGVMNAAELPQAQAEALRFSANYAPTTALEARRDQVEAVLEGTIPVDLLHVALHGQFDASTQEDGLVLLRPDGMGGHEREFLTALSVGGLLRNQATTPFVFLNACQAGAGNEVLGTYAGLAVAVLRTGASGVVAPLWNIDDTVAATLADRFYAGALGARPVAVAELLRQFRADYTLAAVQADPEGVTATFLAYQFFGHPLFELRLDRPADSPEDHHG